MPKDQVNEEDDECSAPVQAAIINSCQEANQEQANAIQASIQATYRESEENKRAAEAEEVDRLVLLADLDDMIYTLESDEELPNPKKWRTNPPSDLTDYENNNKKQVPETLEVKRAHEAMEEAENPGKLDREQPDTENRRTEFFPDPESKSAKLARREDPSRQLNVHGHTAEFPMSVARGIAEEELTSLHIRLLKYGLLMGPGKIVGARPAIGIVKSDRNATMRVTYDTLNTKKIVVKAAKEAGLWGHREKNGKIRPFFRDVMETGRNNPAKSTQTKRKRKETNEEAPKINSKKPKTNVTHVPETASETQESEDVPEEERKKEFVDKEMKKEIIQVENEKAIKCQEKENEDEISNFLKATRTESSQVKEHTSGQESAKETEEEDIELEYMSSNEEYR